MTEKKIYFLSDVHLGSPYAANAEGESSLRFEKEPDHSRERKLCRWLDRVKADASVIYFLGDIFDYWFEYKYVVPRGFTRFLGKVSELTDQGIEIHFFIGNHDIWVTDYLEKECGMIVHTDSCIVEHFSKKFFLSHGDGLGDNSKTFRFLRSLFHNKTCRIAYAAIHPRWTVGFAHRWSLHSRKTGEMVDYLGEDKEYLVRFAKEYLEHDPSINFFIFGHRHILLDLMLKQASRVVILGDWINHFSYGCYDGNLFCINIFDE